MTDTPESATRATAALPRWNACQNEGCDGTMQTTRVTCGRDSGSEKRCSKCGRTVEYGWGGSRVLYEGRCRVTDGCLLEGGHPDDCLVPEAEGAMGGASVVAEPTTTAATVTDAVIAMDYFDREITPTLGDVPPDGLNFMRKQYVKDATANPAALAQIREWAQRV